ncbi:MAG TPA: COR domain-containing protein [Phycisphaerales bacterium]|nr:COR domain-containing protein [Phycisphaerales bacterium]HMP36964.1 COR domain-containing protein [Phycisphaerales bacterium]
MPTTPPTPPTQRTLDPHSLRVIVSADGATIRNATVAKGDSAPALDWQPSDEVVKLVLGDPPRRGKQPEKLIQLARPLPADLAACYPNLRECHLWGLAGIESIATLPAALRTLDIRGCADLRALPRLPAGIETLILERCPALTLDVDANGAALPALEELSIHGSPEVPWRWIDAVLIAARRLWSLDASECPAIERIAESHLGDALEELRLEKCPNLIGLPERLPRRLRRLELSGSSRLATLPDDVGDIDLINLAGMRALRSLPPIRRTRTLFLFGSGVASPPRTLHGESAESDVAAPVRGFFRDVALSGRGVASRAKMLLLGNGEAGKTSLSLTLQPDPEGRSASDLGSTHGVRFCEWSDGRSPRPGSANPGSSPAPAHDAPRAQALIPVHIWDFGGQEIYHAQHRHFANSGTVFVILWESADQSSTRSDSATDDPRRSLAYWFNFILRGRTEPPRIAVVRSKCAQRDDSARKEYESETREEYKAIIAAVREAWARAETVGARAGEFAAAIEAAPLFFIDSPEGATPTGDIDALRTWLETAVAAEAEATGGSVSKLWEIAAAMLDRWLDRMGSSPDFFAAHSQMLPDRFEAKLRHELEERIGAWRRESHASASATHAIDQIRAEEEVSGSLPAAATGGGAPSDSMERLAGNLESGALLLDDDRIERLLDFLSRSGWIYWSRHLAGKRLIVDQAWAIKGIYRVLDHRKISTVPGGRSITEWLGETTGRVTAKELDEFVWSGSFNPDEQALMISMMEDLGVCFRLGRSDRWQSGIDATTTLVVCAYLPDMPDSDASSRLRRNRARYDTVLDGKPGFEDAEWVALLRAFGRAFGERAAYARRGVLHTSGQRGLGVFIELPDGEPGPQAQRYRVVIVGHEDEAEARDLLDEVAAALGVPAPPRSEVDAVSEEDAAAGEHATSRRALRRGLNRAGGPSGDRAFANREAHSAPLAWFFETGGQRE